MFLLFKTLHVAAVVLWFAGLFLLPTLLAAHARRPEDDDATHFFPLTRRLYFHVATPAAVVAVVVGGVLIAFTQAGAWLPAKLLLVAVALALHVYLGLALFDLSNGRRRHRSGVFRLLAWTPLLLAFGIVGLTSVKPLTLAPLDAATVVPATPVPHEPGGDSD